MQTLRGYELREKLGAGGFGVVWRAWQPVIEREVAIKVILPQYANQPAFVRRFETEAQLVARLEHLHIVPLYDYWRDPAGAYLVLRWLRGGSLREQIKRGPLPLPTAMRLLEQIGGALTAAHRQGVVHRDVKPENILLDEEGNAYLSDFGIAQVLAPFGPVPAPAAEEEADSVSGSLSYISPELARNLSPSAASDLYSLGIVIFEALTGSHPFPNLSPAAQLIKHLTEPLPPLRQYNSGLPEVLEPILQRATAKDPTARYPSAQDFAQALRMALPGTLAAITPLSDDLARKVTNPYKGLRAFEEADAQDFFGRTTLVQTLLAALTAPGPYARFLAVVGPSGSGKSSVVKAGLLPALRQGAVAGAGEWFYAEMTPGTNPLIELAQSLLRVAVNPPPDLASWLQGADTRLAEAIAQLLPPGSELLLTVDQFEEVFTQTANKTAAMHFLRLLFFALTQPGSRLRVVITLRADFYDRPLLHPNFSQLMRERTVVVTPLTADELAQAIQEPAERVGVFFENTLIATIVSEVNEQPGALPLLQYALTELFERRQGVLLTRAAYQTVGGVLGALARRAEVVYLALTPAQQALAQQLFLRLVTLGEGVEDTRRRVLQTELEALGATHQALPEVLRTFGQARLLAFDRDPATRAPTVEVAHEALIREWERLREWLATSRAEVRLQRQLAQAAAEWVAAQRDNSFLLSGARLAQFATWAEPAAGARVALTHVEQEFLQASLSESARQVAAEAARQAREVDAARKLAETEHARAEEQAQAAQHLRRRAWLLGAMAVGAIILMFLVVMFGQRSLENQLAAERHAATATVAQGQAQAQAQAAQTSAAQAATAAYRADQSAHLAETERDTARSLALASAAQAALIEGDTTRALALAVAANHFPQPSGLAQRVLYEASHAPGVARLLRGQPENGPAINIKYAPDSGTALVNYANATLGWWDLETGRLHQSWPMANVENFAYLPTSTAALLVYAGTPTQDPPPPQIINLENGQVLQTLEVLTPTAWTEVVVSPDGQSAWALGQEQRSQTRVLAEWDLATGQMRRTLHGMAQEGSVQALTLVPDLGRLLLTGLSDTHQQVTWWQWEVATGALVTQTTQAQPLRELVRSVGFSPDGRWLATGGAYGQLLVWDVATGALVRQLANPHLNGVAALAWHPTQPWVFAANTDTHITLWEANTGEVRWVFRGYVQPTMHLAVDPAGQYFISHEGDPTLRLWEINSAEQTPMTVLPNGVGMMAFSADWQQGLVGYSNAYQMDAVARTTTGTYQVQASWPLQTPVNWLALSRQGSPRLAVVNESEVWVWPTTALTPAYKMLAQPDTVWHAALSPNGEQFVMLYMDEEVGESLLRVFDTASGQPQRDLRVPGTVPPLTLAFSNDNRYLLLAHSEPAARRFWVKVWDWQTDTVVRQWESAAGPLVFAQWRASDQEIVGVGDDGGSQIWEVATGRLLRQLVGPFPVRYATLNPNGENIALISQGGEVAVVALNTGDILRRTTFTGGVVPLPIFSPDGEALLVSPFQQQPVRWELRLNLADSLAWAYTHRYVRDLTCSERTLFGLPSCAEDGQPAPTSTPVFVPTAPPTAAPSLGPSTPLPTWTPTPGPASTATPPHTPQPLPTITLTAQLGDNVGMVPSDGVQGWIYTGTAGERLRLQLNYTETDPQLGLVLEIFDATGTRLVHDLYAQSPTLFIVPATGRYLITVRGYNYSGGGNYVLNITAWNGKP